MDGIELDGHAPPLTLQLATALLIELSLTHHLLAPPAISMPFAGDGTRALDALLAQALTALRALKAALAAPAGPAPTLYHPHVAAAEAGWADFQACAARPGSYSQQVCAARAPGLLRPEGCVSAHLLLQTDLVFGIVNVAAQIATVVANLPDPRIAFLDIVSRHRADARFSADPALWEELRTGVVDELEAGRAASAAAAGPEHAAAEALAAAVEGTQALGALQCANPACTMIFPVAGAGVKEASRKRCSSCLLVKYCGAACQRAHWRAHKAPCRELLRLREQQAGPA